MIGALTELVTANALGAERAAFLRLRALAVEIRLADGSDPFAYNIETLGGPILLFPAGRGDRGYIDKGGEGGGSLALSVSSHGARKDLWYAQRTHRSDVRGISGVGTLDLLAGRRQGRYIDGPWRRQVQKTLDSKQAFACYAYGVGSGTGDLSYWFIDQNGKFSETFWLYDYKGFADRSKPLIPFPITNEEKEWLKSHGPRGKPLDEAPLDRTNHPCGRSDSCLIFWRSGSVFENGTRPRRAIAARQLFDVQPVDDNPCR